MLNSQGNAFVLAEENSNIEQRTTTEPSLEQLLSEIIVSNKLKSSPSEKELEERLDALMQSHPIKKILETSIELAEEQNIERKEAIIAILDSIKKLEKVWEQILLREGLENLTKPYR